MRADNILALLSKSLGKCLDLYVDEDKLHIHPREFDRRGGTFQMSSEIFQVSNFLRKKYTVTKHFIHNPNKLRIFLNDLQIRLDKVEVNPNDVIRVGNVYFTLDGPQWADISPIITVRNLQVQLQNKIILKKINFTAYRGEMIAIAGPSGCGKTTLLRELAGQNNKTQGSILVDGKDLEDFFHSHLKDRIGYVEQTDHFHEDLSVSQILTFSSKIRGIVQPKDVLEQLLVDLKIDKFFNRQFKNLSLGQQKRVAIIAELLNQPDIILLDEPTSPLDPESVKEFLIIIKKIAKLFNKTIVMVTHKPSDLKYFDKLLFLSQGGHQVYFGKEENFQSEIGELLELHLRYRDSDEKLLSIYRLFSDEKMGARHERSCSSDNTYRYPRAKESIKFNIFYQFYWLTHRYFLVKFPANFENNRHDDKNNMRGNNKTELLKALFNYNIQPVLVGLLFFAFPFFNITCLFLISLSVIWFGVNNACKEIVSEIHIYKKDRAFNLKVDSYIISKIIVLFCISLVQNTILLSVVWFRFFISSSINQINLFDPVRTWCFLSILSLASITLGLLISTFSEKTEKVLLWVPLVLMAQIIFSGLVSKPDRVYKENLSYLMVGRWGLEGLARIQDLSSKDKNVTKKYTDSVFKKDTLINIADRYSVVKDRVTDPPDEQLVSDTTGALKLLGSYEDVLRRDHLKPWGVFDSLCLNNIALLTLSMLSYFLCRLSLLKKDDIPIISILNKKNISYIFHSVFIALLAAILVSPIFKTVIKSNTRNYLTEKNNRKRMLENQNLLEWYEKVSKK